MSLLADVGMFVWCWNDEDWLKHSLAEFRTTVGDGVYLLGISNASTDGSIDFLEIYCDEVMHFEYSQCMSKCVNTGYQRTYELGYKYLGWIHPDMRFKQKGWVEVLKSTLETYPQIGKISCENEDHKSGLDEIYPGAEAGNLIRSETFNDLGGYDEAYVGCGGYEDWDIQRRYISAGLGNYINPRAKVWHRHAGTREKIDHGARHIQWLQNQQTYHRKWNTYDNAMVPDGWGHLLSIG